DEGERAKKETVEQAEDRRIPRDADGQYASNDQSERGSHPDLPPREADVLPQRVQHPFDDDDTAPELFFDLRSTGGCRSSCRVTASPVRMRRRRSTHAKVSCPGCVAPSPYWVRDAIGAG